MNHTLNQAPRPALRHFRIAVSDGINTDIQTIGSSDPKTAVVLMLSRCHAEETAWLANDHGVLIDLQELPASWGPAELTEIDQQLLTRQAPAQAAA